MQHLLCWSSELIIDIFIAFAPLLLERKAIKLRKELESQSSNSEKNGRLRPREVRTRFDSSDRHWQQIFIKALTRPFKLFFTEPIIQLFGIYMAFIYGLMYRKYYSSIYSHLPKINWYPSVFLTTIPSIFEGVYQQRVGIAGLHYFALGVGLSAASQINARFMDRIYRHFAVKNGGKGRPEYRLRE
jgi:hypothetical protein